VSPADQLSLVEGAWTDAKHLTLSLGRKEEVRDLQWIDNYTLLLVFFFFGIKPENPYFVSRPGLEANPLSTRGSYSTGRTRHM